MEKAVIDVIDFIDAAVNKTEQFNDYSPEMSNKVLDNRIMTLEGYIRYIERETMPRLESLVEKLEEVNDG
ncbi:MULTISPECIES: hypothetical protein [Halanaerobium]|uniref:Uncharacterized protein n=1 Tax=Halanaerobium saccharolyticum TaxID=43595 RepID=A0A4R6S512_9FIRM|nr:MULTISPECIES: hypothetical protein [Halanaerobium]PUU94706.1 MAG: hypothetical protein CI947_479 [Halanaerobium sp.]PUU94845.1 MAG: hypothetical protein CI949_486 [Halanaerobium sp.]TDP94741.1 hypothetical protein C7957_11080 [Halanaerobium saccharolyticum]